jgi:uncharacterized membrane protein
VSRKVDLVLYLAMAVVFAGALWMAKDWPLDARMFPFLMAGAGLVMLAIALVGHVRGLRLKKVAEKKEEAVVLKELAAYAWITGFFVSVALLGFQWGLPGMILTYLKVEGNLKWVLSLIFAACCWLFLYTMRAYLHLPLYDGFLLKDF